MAATTALREALNKGISSGNLIDTKIILYSHRDSSARVCRPKALYTNSHILKTVPYFNDLLFGNFSESQSKDFKEAIDEEELAKNYGYSSDSDLEEDEGLSSSKDTPKPKVHPSDPPAIPEKDRAAYEKRGEHVDKGKVVKIPDMAFVTFQAFLVYLYTGVIEFAPFGSDENRRSRNAELAEPSDNNVPRPSPKSIYRLADKYDVPALKGLALNHIFTQLPKCNIIEESCSRFASQYDDIRSLYVGQLAYTWATDPTEATRKSVEKKIDSFVEGNLEHAAEAVFTLLEIANKDGNITAPSNSSPAVTQVKSPPHWDSVKTALIASVRRGVFFDRKYWARHSKSGDVLKPVYFSSTIMSDKAQQLNNLVKYLKGQNLASYLEGDANVDSDCDGDSQGVRDELPSVKDEKEEETCAVLTTGSFSAWKSLFFYRCTNEVLFAPLRSQGVDYRSNYIREETVAATPPPCSPKGIYALASMLGIEPLCDSAFADIKDKMTLDNVVRDIFSSGTVGQEKVMELQWNLLNSNFKNAKTASLVKENMKRISDGSSTHCADTLKLGLKKAFDLKTCVKLRCPNCYCAWHKDPVPVSSIGPDNYYCRKCLNQGQGFNFLTCTNCRYSITSNYTTCPNCRKRFL